MFEASPYPGLKSKSRPETTGSFFEMIFSTRKFSESGYKFMISTSESNQRLLSR